MPRSRAVHALVGLFLGATVGTCVFPTEHDGAVHVSLFPLHILLRGATAVRRATAWQIISGTDSQPIPNVKFVWSSSDPLTASVDNEGRVVGIKSGMVTITAAAANFGTQARPARDTVRVSAALEIDSVSPDTVRYGDRLSIYGVGVDSIFQASLGNGILIPVPFSTQTYANGTARARYWVPPPAVTDSLFYLGITNGNGVFGFVHGSTTKVLPHDLYDPNITNPRRLSLTGAVPFPQLPFLLFWNPALAFEELPLGATASADWYRLGLAVPHDITVIIESPQLAGTYQTFMSDSLGWSSTRKQYFIGHDSWTFGPGSHACHGLRFEPAELTPDSTIVAFKGLTKDSLDVIATYRQPGRYGLEVIDTLVTELPTDTHEDDNSCNAADARLPVQAVGTFGFRDTLAIENPHDIDWIRFTAPNPAPLSGTDLRVRALSGVNPDSTKFLTFYVIKVPAPGDTALSIIVTDTAVASALDHQVTAPLTPGTDYYAVVLDYAGSTTYYEICIQPAQLIAPATCPGSAPWPASPAVAAARGPTAGATAPRTGRVSRFRPNGRRAGARRVPSLLELGPR